MQPPGTGGNSKGRVSEGRDSKTHRAQTVDVFRGRVDEYFQKFL